MAAKLQYLKDEIIVLILDLTLFIKFLFKMLWPQMSHLVCTGLSRIDHALDVKQSGQMLLVVIVVAAMSNEGGKLT
jgi:hypothetical protein